MSASSRTSRGLLDTLASRELRSRPSPAQTETEPSHLALRPRLPYAFHDGGAREGDGLDEVSPDGTHVPEDSRERTVERPPEPIPSSTAAHTSELEPSRGARAPHVPLRGLDTRDHGTKDAARKSGLDHHHLAEHAVTRLTEVASQTQITRVVEQPAAQVNRTAQGIDLRGPRPAMPSSRDRQRLGTAPPRRDRVDPFHRSSPVRDERDTAIEIHIGRIEVRAALEPPPPRPARRESPTDTRLADYLHARTSGASS